MTMNNDYAFDKVAGLIAIVTNFCCGALVMVLAGGLALFGTAAASLPGFVVGSLVGLIAILVGGSAVFGIIAGVGIFQGRRWGFLLGAIVFGLAALLNGLGSGNAVGFIIDAGLCAYCVLRLAGNVGPKVLD